MKTQTIGDTSINEIELSVRAANIINYLDILTIRQLVENCTTEGRYTGLKGNARGIKGVGLNFEIATKLLELELIDGVQHLKKPVTQFDPPNQERLKEIGSSCAISLTSSLSDLNWEKDELVHIQNVYFGINEDTPFTKASVLDLIQQYIRIDNQNRLILRTWGYRSKSKYNLLFIVEPRLEEWGVLDPKRRNKKVLVRKLSQSQYEKWEAKNKPVAPPYVPKTLLSHIQSYYYNLYIGNQIEILHSRIIGRRSYYILDQIDRLWERIDRMMIPEEVLKNIPLTTQFDELSPDIKKDVLSLTNQVKRFKRFFTPELRERLKALIPSKPRVFSSVSMKKSLLLLDIYYEIDVFFIRSRNSLYNFNSLKKDEELY